MSRTPNEEIAEVLAHAKRYPRAAVKLRECALRYGVRTTGIITAAAAVLGVGVGTVRRWLRDERQAPPSAARLLAMACGLSTPAGTRKRARRAAQ